MERERAAWEYGDRLRHGSISRIVDMAASEPDPAVRWGLLWLMQKVAGGDSAAVHIAPFMRDTHPEVRDWARLLVTETTGACDAEEQDGRKAQFDLGNPFDQTLPLMIAGHATTLIPRLGWVKATLSPQWFESIMGRVMACTQTSSFKSDLVIEKAIRGYHPDGSDHFEIFKFRGFTFHPLENINHHVYECLSTHSFYPSGKVEDLSVDPIDDVGVVLNRVALTVPMAMTPDHVLSVDGGIYRSGLRPEEACPSRVVRSVRGRYMGTAFVNVERLLASSLHIGPGEVQLSSPNHPIAGRLTNTFLSGTFKGKLSDLNGDGNLDINTEPCHGTIDGKLDYTLSGEPNSDPFDPFALV
jgi:hypothetical protein